MANTLKAFHIEKRYTEINSNALKKYFSDLKVNFDTSPIPKDKERELIKKAQKGCLKSRDRLVHANLRFVISYAKTFYKANPVMQMGDLIQEGNAGLVHSIMRYDLKHNYKLFTYARFWMCQRINSSILRNMNSIRLSSNGIKDNFDLKKARSVFYTSNQRNPTDEELSSITGISVQRIRSFLKITYTRSLNEKQSSNEGESREVLDSLSCEAGFDIVDSLSSILKPYLMQLKARERKLLEYRFGIGVIKKNRADRAKIVGITPERARQIEKNGLESLKELVQDDESILQFL